MKKKNYVLFEFFRKKLMGIRDFEKSRCVKIGLLAIVIIFSSVKISFCLTSTVIYVKEIEFDYDGSRYANDALTVRDANGNEALVPEMQYYVYSGKVAYIKGQSNRTIAVKFATNCPNSNLVVSLETISGEGIGVVSNYAISNYTSGSFVYIPLNGTLPNNIGEH
jgi:hypothetical protein